MLKPPILHNLPKIIQLRSYSLQTQPSYFLTKKSLIFLIKILQKLYVDNKILHMFMNKLGILAKEKGFLFIFTRNLGLLMGNFP